MINSSTELENLHVSLTDAKPVLGAAPSVVYNEDCVEGLKRFSDNHFDLAIVDPPYGINADIKNNGKNSDRHEKTSLAKINTYKKTNWDNETPNEDYFNELKRVSKKQIIWGANFFGLVGGMLYWHKNITMPTYSTAIHVRPGSSKSCISHTGALS